MKEVSACLTLKLPYGPALVETSRLQEPGGALFKKNKPPTKEWWTAQHTKGVYHMDTTKKLGQIIEEKRNQAGYSQAELADIMPFSAWYSGTISILENGERYLTLEEAVYLAKVLGCALVELAAPFIKEAQGWDPATAYAEKQEIRAEIENLQKKLQGMEKK